MKNNQPPGPVISPDRSFIFLRAVLGMIFITHGIARIYYDSNAAFGSFLNSEGFYFGEYIAWAITTGEIVGGIFLIFGLFIKYAVIFHFVIILMGIFLVHLPNGWFVVGHGNGGIEYSVLILTVLVYIFIQSSPTTNFHE